MEVYHLYFGIVKKKEECGGIMGVGEEQAPVT